MNPSGPGLGVRSRVLTVVLTSLSCMVASWPTSAQASKPNLSGTWDLNLSKSKPSPLRKSRSDSYKILLSEPNLVIEHRFASGNVDTCQYTTNAENVSAEFAALGHPRQGILGWRHFSR